MRLSPSLTFTVFAQILLALHALATPNPIDGNESVNARSPAIWYNQDAKKYYLFSTGGNITIFTSPSLSGPWAKAGSALPHCSSMNLGTSTCTLWAADVNFVNGRYVLYFASTANVGSQNSVIGVATSPSMDPGTWTDHGKVISSKGGDAFNAIDANFINSNGFKLNFGSYHNGMFQVNLSDITTPSTALPGAHIAGSGGRPAEGGFMYKPPSSAFYYYFFSYGIAPTEGLQAEGKEYRVLVGRSKSVSGPFVGGGGRDLTLDATDPPPGSVVLASHDNVYAPGGQSAYHDPVSDRDIIVYYYARKNDTNVGARTYLGINYLDFSSGWPVLVD